MVTGGPRWTEHNFGLSQNCFALSIDLSVTDGTKKFKQAIISLIEKYDFGIEMTRYFYDTASKTYKL